MTTKPEHPRDRIARHFGLGDYGKRLAAEILRDYRKMIADDIQEQGYTRLACYVELEFDEDE